MTTTLPDVPTPIPTVAPTRPAQPPAPTRESLAVLAVRPAQTLEAPVARFLNAAAQNLGHLEDQVFYDVQSLLRETLQCAAQAQADVTPPHYPVCGQPLSRCSSGHARTFQTRFGDVTTGEPRNHLLPRARKAHGLPGRAAGGGTDWQRAGGSDLSAGTVPFKCPGQFWSTAGEKALLGLETFWRNPLWSLLFSHTAFDPAKN